MEQIINSKIHECYNEYSYYGDRAECVANYMTAVYNKNKWSCILGNYGANIWGYAFYMYTYDNIGWTVFLGASK